MPLFIAITPVRITLGLARRTVFCRSSETAAAADYFLAVRTDGKRNATFSRFPHDLVQSMCALYKYGFVESLAVCALLLRTKVKRRKRLWVHPLVSQKLLKGQFHKLYVDLRMHPK